MQSRHICNHVSYSFILPSYISFMKLHITPVRSLHIVFKLCSSSDHKHVIYAQLTVHMDAVNYVHC